ncbi:MAG: hypothetical protein ACRDRN_16550 [Sciscionella sp.]
MRMPDMLAGMPDLWLRLLDEHIPDQDRNCQACRDSVGNVAAWPCRLREIAEQARAIYRSGR